MRLTAEIRWFWPDRPPQEFHGWFVGAGATWTMNGSTETRVDEYLRDPDQTLLGIKKRGRGDVGDQGADQPSRQESRLCWLHIADRALGQVGVPHSRSR